MSGNKTQPTGEDVSSFLSSVEPEGRRLDALSLDALFRDVTGWNPVMWGPSIVGYGQYHYVYKTGREGDFLATGFSPRKSGLSIYIMPGYSNFGSILARLGKHGLGKSCLNLKKLADADRDVLGELIRAGVADLNGYWPVEPT